MLQMWPMLYLVQTICLGICKSHPDGTGFEGMKGSWRTADAWYCESPGEATGKGAASVADEGSGLKGSSKEDEAWHHEEAYERLLVTVQPSCSRDPSILEMPVPWDDHQEQQQQ